MQFKLALDDLWSSSFTQVQPHLLGASHLLSTWLSEARQLSLDWTHGIDNGGHLWLGAAFSDGHVGAIHARIEQASRHTGALAALGASGAHVHSGKFACDPSITRAVNGVIPMAHE